MLNLKANIWDDEGLSVLLTCLLHFCSLAYFLLLSKLYKQHNNINYREFYSGIGPFLGPQKDIITCFYVSALPISVLVCVTTLIFKHAHFELICINFLELVGNIFFAKSLSGTSCYSRCFKCIKTRTDTYAHTHAHTTENDSSHNLCINEFTSDCFRMFYQVLFICDHVHIWQYRYSYDPMSAWLCMNVYESGSVWWGQDINLLILFCLPPAAFFNLSHSLSPFSSPIPFSLRDFFSVFFFKQQKKLFHSLYYFFTFFPSYLTFLTDTIE